MKYHIFLYNKAGTLSFNSEFIFVIPNVIDGSDFIDTSSTSVMDVTWRKIFTKYFGGFMKSTYGFLAIPEGTGCSELKWIRLDAGVNKHMSVLTSPWPIVTYNFDVTGYNLNSPIQPNLLSLIVGSTGFKVTWNNGVDVNLGGVSMTLFESSDVIGGTVKMMTYPFLPFTNKDASNYPPAFKGYIVEIPASLSTTETVTRVSYNVTSGSSNWKFSDAPGAKTALEPMTVTEIVPVGMMSNVTGPGYPDDLNPLTNFSPNNAGTVSNNGIVYAKR